MTGYHFRAQTLSFFRNSGRGAFLWSLGRPWQASSSFPLVESNGNLAFLKQANRQVLILVQQFLNEDDIMIGCKYFPSVRSDIASIEDCLTWTEFVQSTPRIDHATRLAGVMVMVVVHRL